MLILLVAYLGGVLTILSPCILPVLPFVFARADRPFRAHGLPLLLGMALAFAAIATLAAVGGGWVVTLNQYGRHAAIALLALFGVTLLFPSLADRLSRPLVALGVRLAEAKRRSGRGLGVLAAAAGRGHRPAVGAVRGADPRADPDRRGAERRERRHLAAAARLCRRRVHLAGGRAAVRRALFSR
jgi:cytochrome c biogenesis protein CcdA